VLCLSRQRDERIVINDDIIITIVEIRGEKVVLGIEAPNSVPVHREEIWQLIQQQNREAEGQQRPKPVRPPTWPPNTDGETTRGA
jgi:carbon storage regulator